MAILLPELPFPKNSLEPYISEKTLDFHYGKHHNAYVTNCSKMIEGTELQNETLENIILKTAGNPAKAGIFNNAAQVWNHTFYWNCIKCKGGGLPKGKIADLIAIDFGTFEKFVEEFKTAAATQFGSGWAWLVLKDNKLQIMKTANADTPMAHSAKALLTIDVWEHAYYLDYQNRRPDYISTYIDKLINWEFVNSNLD